MRLNNAPAALAKTLVLQVSKLVEMNGSGTRSSLMYETIRIVSKLKPKYVIWENVKNLLSKKHRHNFDNYLDKMAELGYRNYYQVLNAKDYGIPQNRERVFTISIRQDIDTEYIFPKRQELKLRLKDMLEDNVDEKYYLSDKGIKYVEKRDGGYTQIATEETEIAHCPITAKGNDNWTGNFIKQVVQMYGTEREPKCVRIGNIYGEGKGGGFAGNVYEKEGLSPALQTMQGGNRQPIIVDNPLKGKTNLSWQFEQQVYGEDGITRAIKANGGSGNIPKLLIKNNTQQGYLEAYEGNGVYTNTSTKRGTVTPQAMHTITRRQDCGVVVAAAQRGRDEGQQLEISDREFANSITTVQKDSLVVDNRNLKEQLCDNLIEQGIVKGGEIINHSYTTSEQRDTLDKYIESDNGIMPTMTTRADILGVVVSNDKRLHNLVEKTNFEQGKVLNMDLYNQTTNENISQCLTEPHHNNQRLYDGLRIRKLTPKECWRLMRL